MATKYIIVHNKHEGCYDFQYYEDNSTKTRLTSITINPPKVFLFTDKEQAHEFFSEYMNDVDVLDIRCKKENDEVEHIDYCTCGCIEMDDDGNPIYREDGKVMKGPNYFKPDFSKILGE